MPFIIPANTLASGGFDVDNSAMFDGTSAYMHKTPSSNPSSADLFTISVWVKRCAIGSSNRQVIFDAREDSENFDRISINSDVLEWKGIRSDSQAFNLTTTQVFRDPNSWYNLHFIWDSADGTADNRMRIFVNGVQVTSFGTRANPSSGLNAIIGANGEVNSVGSGARSGDFWDGYMAEFVYLDGQEVTPDENTGEFDEDSGIWKPIDVSGLTFGTNGFYLDFEASGNLGNDANGGTDLTEVGFAATDQSTDTCTNNFATMLPLTKSTDATLSEGNLNVTYGTASTRRAIFGSIVVTAGKWFCETKIIATSQTSVEMNLGISNTYNPEAIGNALISANGFTVSLFPSNGSLYIGSTRDEQGLGNLAVNDIIGMAINIDDGTLQFYKNGSALGSANDITTGDSDDGELYPGFTIANSCSSGGQTFTASHNFGSPAYSESGGNSDASGFGNFSMSVPSGFFSICTKNLAEYG